MNLQRGTILRDKQDKILWKITADYRGVDTKLDFEIENLKYGHYNTVTEFELVDKVESGQWQVVNING